MKALGRLKEVDALTKALDHALEGDGRVVLMPGDAGIGKTRLADQLAATAGGRGALTLWGRCRDSAGIPPFWPWVQVVRQIRNSIDGDTLARLTRQDDSSATAPG